MTPAAGADVVRRHALTCPPRLRTTRVVCVDGPSGSGKTTLAAALAASVTGPVQVVATDELLPGGWDGLPGLDGRVRLLLGALAAGREGRWRRWDWEADRWAEQPWHRVRGGGLLVLEGVGCWDPSYADLVTTLAWVEAPRDARRARGVARDDGMAEHWRRFGVAEDTLHRAAHTRARADVRLVTV